ILSDVERTVDSMGAAVVADRLGDGRDVRVIEGAAQRRTAMSAGVEADELRRIIQLGLTLVVLQLESVQVDQDRRRGRLAGQWGDRPGFSHIVEHSRLSYNTGHGVTRQMSAAYSEMLRSLENLPELATLRIALRAHASGSA